MEQLFQQLGYSQSETKVYLALAETGKASATVIAKRTKMPRSTAYSILNALVSRGLISTEHDQDSILYVPNPPSTLALLITAEAEEHARQAKERTAIARQLEEQVAPYFQRQRFSVPKILMFEGRKNVEAMLYSYEKEWQQQIVRFDQTWWGYQDVHFVENYRKWLDHYWSQLLPKERIWLFSNQSKLEKKLRGQVERRIIKQLPPGKEFSSTIWVLGDYVVLIMTRHEPNYAMLIHDAVLAANQRQVFQLLWQVID